MPDGDGDGDGGVELELLPDCTVRIDVGGGPKGSGFFVVPGVVVTCAHVIESQQLMPGDTDPAIEVVTPAGEHHPVHVKKVWPPDAEDVALLHLVTPFDHPCVLLASGLQARDPLHSFGFPENHPEGVPTTLDAEGFTGNGKLVKFKEGQVRGGMSGSPVLNVRTGAVCAMVKRSIDPGRDAGGYGVRVETLLQLEPKLFQTENKRYHDVNKQWLALLHPQQRARLRVRRPLDAEAAVTFVVSIGQVEDDWLVEAHIGSNDEALGPVRVEFNAIRAQVARLLRDWASRGRVAPGTQNELLGEILFRAAFPGEIGARLHDLLRTRKEQPLLVGLHFRGGTERSLVTLPWEHLFVPNREDAGGVYLAADTSVSFVRCREEEPELARGESIHRELSVLMVGVPPPKAGVGEEGAFDSELVERVTEGAELIKKDVRGLVLDVVEARDPLELADLIAEGDHQVIHAVAFGRFSQRTDERQRTDELVAEFTFAALSDCLQRGTPQLVVLQLLEADQQLVAADFALLAPSLVTQSIRSVLAYQYPVKPKAATLFNRALYTALAGGVSVDVAVQTARNSLWMFEQTSRAFISPALFVARPGRMRLVHASAGGIVQQVGSLSS
jgi:hypothetical protein